MAPLAAAWACYPRSGTSPCCLSCQHQSHADAYPRPPTGAWQLEQPVVPSVQHASQSPFQSVPSGQHPPGAHCPGPPGQHVVSMKGSSCVTQQPSPAAISQHGLWTQSATEPAQQAHPIIGGHQPSAVQMPPSDSSHVPLQHSSPRPQHAEPQRSSTIGQQASFATQTPLGQARSV